MRCTQDEVDRVVARCDKLVSIHGGASDKLAEVRKRYEMFYDCPESGALVALEAELDKVESLTV